MTDTDLTFYGPQRISAALFVRVLKDAKSPAFLEAPTLAMIPLQYGIDRAVALAFFKHESSYGKVGVATHTRGWGNLRKGMGRSNGVYTSPVSGTFATYATYADSLIDWCELIHYYVSSLNLRTVRPALRRYAPSSDGNNPDAYGNAVIAQVNAWMTQERGQPGPQPGAYIFRGLPIWQRADLTGPIAGYLSGDSVITIDAVEGPGYAPTAGHLADERGFVDMSKLDRS